MKLSSFVSLVGLACATPFLVLDALSDVAVPINIWNITPPDLPVDLVSGTKDAITAVTFESGRKGLRATLSPGSYRTEFEWGDGFKSDNVTYADYQHMTGDELWVGFRMRVRDPGANGNISVFQLGPVRDTAYTTSSVGYYQLQLRQRTSTEPHYWWWREFGRGPTIPGHDEDLSAIGFNPTYESAWVAHLKMRTDSTGVVSLWFNGRLQFTHQGPNALATDFTRVKWGPYVGENTPVPASITAEYMHIVMAEGGGDDGYRTVAPGEWQSFTNGVFSKAVTISSTAANAGVTTVQVSGLPYGWTFSPTTRVISGSNSPLVAGARIMIRFMKADNTEYERTVWIFPGDPRSPTADLNNNGVPNSAE